MLAELRAWHNIHVDGMISHGVHLLVHGPLGYHWTMDATSARRDGRWHFVYHPAS